jgi:hypothetical protein
MIERLCDQKPEIKYYLSNAEVNLKRFQELMQAWNEFCHGGHG